MLLASRSGRDRTKRTRAVDHTPGAPLLLDLTDALCPDFVELLHPGYGYTGGREFLIDHADRVVRVIPDLDEQAPRGLPTTLPSSLVTEAASFMADAAMLLLNPAAVSRISMLVHSTHRNDVQSRYAPATVGRRRPATYGRPEQPIRSSFVGLQGHFKSGLVRRAGCGQHKCGAVAEAILIGGVSHFRELT